MFYRSEQIENVGIPTKFYFRPDLLTHLDRANQFNFTKYTHDVLKVQVRNSPKEDLYNVIPTRKDEQTSPIRKDEFAHVRRKLIAANSDVYSIS